MRHLLRIVMLIALAWTDHIQAQEPGARRLASRRELHIVETLTLSDEHFLVGDASGGRSVTVAGELGIAQGAGRLPVVVMIHGSGGIDARAQTWADQFHAMGVSTFVLDGFTGRGFASVAGDQALLGRLNLILDAYRVLGILAKHPRVDPTRIVLMGFSRGGQATLYASLERFHRLWNKSGIDFAGYMPFYPDCSTTYLTDVAVVERPIRIFHGRLDDTNPVARCQAYVARLRQAGRDVQLTQYPNAQHTFDNPLGSPTPMSSNSQTVRNCVIREEPAGHLINAATKQRFTYQDACVESGTHSGYDAVATRAAHQAVGTFLKETFRLP